MNIYGHTKNTIYYRVCRYTNPNRADARANTFAEIEENPMKKIKKKWDRKFNPMPPVETDPIEVEYKIMINNEKKVKE